MKKHFSKTVIPILLLVIAVFVIGASCNSEPPPNVTVQTCDDAVSILEPIFTMIGNEGTMDLQQHGIFNKEENGLITLQFNYIDATTFRVEIIDNGVGYKSTKSLTRKKENSSNVLQDRLRFLNQSRKWSITHELSLS